MWRLASLFLVGFALAANAAPAQVPPPESQTTAPAQQPDNKTPAPPAGASQPPAATTSPSITIPLTSPPATPTAQPAEPSPAPPGSEPVKPPVDAAASISGPATSASAPAQTAKPKPPKPKRPKLVPVDPGNEREDPTLAKDEAGSSKPPSFRCFVRDVMAFYDRTHVRCYNKARGKFIFFAVDTGQPIASTLFSKALSGIQFGKPVTITYAPGSDLNPSNCDAANCRRLLDIKN